MEMKQYLAHIRRDASAEQTVRAHLLRVGNLMAAYAEGIGLSATARLIGVRQVARKCRAYGQRVQNSVFECKVDPTQCKQLELALLDIIDLQEDSLRFYYLGKDKGPKVTHYGVKESYDLEAAIII